MTAPWLEWRSTRTELRVVPTQVLKAGMTFSFDGFHKWSLSDSTTKTISVEEMVVITEEGARWMTPPGRPGS